MISKIDGLASLANLTILDLSNNRITKVENLSCCPQLQTINLSKNALSYSDSLDHLKDCLRVDNIDLTSNNIPADDSILEKIILIPSLLNLTINGNELTKLPHFRKKMIANMPKLCYLDRPIDELERLRSVAFITEGAEAEKKVMEDYKIQQQNKRIEEMTVFRNWQEEHRKKAMENLQMYGNSQGSSAITNPISEMDEEEQVSRVKSKIIATNGNTNTEKEMLELGVENIAKKYWEIEALDRSKSVEQLLAESVAAVKLDLAREEAAQQELNHLDVIDTVHEDGYEVVNVVKSTVGSPVPNNADVNTLKSPEKTQKMVHFQTEQLPPVKEVHVEPVDPIIESVRNEMENYKYDAGEEEILGNNDIMDSLVSADEVLVDTPAEQELRRQRVEESLYIFNKQMEMKKVKQQQQQQQITNTTTTKSAWEEVRVIPHRSTWDDMPEPIITKPAADVSISTLYWTEKMDLLLAKCVKESSFDFNLVSAQLITAQKKGQFSEQLNMYTPTYDTPNNVELVNRQQTILTQLLSADAVRLRWADLDANKWSVPSNGVSSGLPNDINHIHADTTANTAIATAAVANHQIYVRSNHITGILVCWCVG